MKNLLKALLVVSSVAWAGIASATPVTITFTGDNIIIDSWGVCDSDNNCQTWESLIPDGEEGAMSNWQTANTVTLDLADGMYNFFWEVTNLGTGGSGNPAGFLAEIVWGTQVNSSSSDWLYEDYPNWVSSTEYGYNGGPNIWTSVNGGPIAGISADAAWIWTENNASIGMDASAQFGTSIYVPEPATLALLGFGLVGIGFARRRAS